MKGLLGKLGKLADSVASYNDGSGGVQASGASGSTSGRAAGLGPLSAAAAAAAAGPAAPAEPPDPALEHLLRNVRSRHVRSHFCRAHPSGYAEVRDVRVLAGSYNVNGKGPPAGGVDMGAWLGLWKGEWPPGGAPDAPRDLPDVIAVGFQEVVPLNAGNVIVGSAVANLEAWDRAIGAYLNGEAWATQRYGTAAATAQRAAVGSAPLPTPEQAGAVLEALDRQWSSGLLAASTGLAGPAAAPAPAGSAPGAGPAAAKAAAAPLVPGAEDGAAWVQVAAKQLVGNYLSVWVRRELLPHVRGVQAVHTATGFGGYLGNKGAVAVRLRVYDHPLVLVSAHLSAGEQEGDELKRNADVAEILRRTDFGALGDSPGAMALLGPALLSAQLGSGHWGNLTSITDHRSVIWMGDLNYRLVGGAIRDEDARAALRAARLQPLLDAEQLLREMAAGRVFQGGWREGPITFPPTFKFKVGTSIYLGEPAAGPDPDGGDEDASTQGGEGAGKQKRRTPAWCDRVLWLNAPGAGSRLPGSGLHQLAYRRSELTCSDHKPVAAAFLLQALHYDRAKVDQVLQEARRAVDMLAAMLRPKCQLSTNQVVVPAPPLEHGVVWSTSVELRNTGQVEGMWHFVPPPSQLGLDDEGPALPCWLTAIPAEGVVQPGEAASITLQVCVDGGAHGAVAALAKPPAPPAGGRRAPAAPAEPTPAQGPAHARTAELDVITILRVEDGGDIFLCVNGSCQLSFLGQSLTHLATLEHAALTVAASAPALPAPAPPGQDPALSTHRRALALLKQLVAAGSLGLPALTVKLRASLPPAQPGHGDDDGDGDEDARPDQPHLRQHQEPAHPHTAPVSEAARLIPAPWRAVLAAPLLLTDAVPPPSPSTWLTHLLTCASSSSSSTVAASASLAPGEVWGERAAKLRVLQQVRALRRWADGADAAARWLGPPPQVEVEGAPGRAAAALVCVALAELPAPLLPPALSELCNSPDFVPGSGLVDSLLSKCMPASDAAVLVALLGLLVRLVGPAEQHHEEQRTALCALLEALLLQPLHPGALPEAQARRRQLCAELLRCSSGGGGAATEASQA